MFSYCHVTCSAPRGFTFTYKNVTVLLVFYASIASSVTGSCPAACICASDIVTCSNKNLSAVPGNYFEFVSRLDLSYNRITILSTDWSAGRLDKLGTLILNHNSIKHISPGTFRKAPNVKYLDLSSNTLSVLSASVFQDLKEMEVLLLFNNQITQINSGSFAGLQKLQRLYLSKNLLTQFPLELFIGKLRLSQLEFLDLSFNSLQEVPVQKIISLPARQQCGIYLHENPLTCDCTLYTMLTYWLKRQFHPVTDFKGDYKCFLPPHLDFPINLFSQTDDFMNCSSSTVNGSFYSSGVIYEVRIGNSLVVHCDSKITHAHSNFFWITPRKELLKTGDSNENLKVFPNGSLEFSNAQIKDTGIYICIVLNHRRNLNESIEVTVKVSNSTSDRSRPHETFNTAFTTLAACVASIILVLIYLYLTPCRCWCKTKKTPRKPNPGSARSSILSTTPSNDAQPERKASTAKRVVFLEPGTELQEGQNGKVKLLASDQVMTESILKNSKIKSDSDSVTSLFSDAPFIT
ncbi:amphoterin-induced protein 2 [Lepisosteus oculatus]|uniref:amphoterin-induced protein 2 n=1 Tax=Lepisosteus oculatus TaxID=7918 RepID=UPI0003EAE255|nr:PREDICTED: amphoterin-induced protein 2 [Lepisosteus oculatus]